MIHSEPHPPHVAPPLLPFPPRLPRLEHPAGPASSDQLGEPTAPPAHIQPEAAPGPSCSPDPATRAEPGIVDPGSLLDAAVGGYYAGRQDHPKVTVPLTHLAPHYRPPDFAKATARAPPDQ
jgi:hypothetical protein